jgi:hypothetical protein
MMILLILVLLNLLFVAGFIAYWVIEEGAHADGHPRGCGS